MPRHPTFPRVCIALGFQDTEALLRCAREEADSGGTFFEFRLDYLSAPQEGIPAIAFFLREYPSCQVLATCRRRENRGYFDGTIAEQVALLEAAMGAGARTADLEIESAERVADGVDRLRSAGQLVVSYHNFNGTPAMAAVLGRMERVPADAYKIVTTARKPSDIQRLLTVSRGRTGTPLILMSMGEIGFPSRVVGPIYGSLYSYAAPAGAAGTASGQVDAHQLRQLYHLERLSRKTRIFGVIADPVGHSLSPAIHNRAFLSRRIDAVYVPFLVPATRLRDFFIAARDLPVTGISVTIPHKQKVIRYLDVIDPLARRIGAVNTVWRKAGKWRGLNTDVAGVIVPLERRLRLAKARVLVAGNGGAARAAAFALADKGACVFLTGRDQERVEKLARAANAQAVMREDLANARFDALVHATPMGMHPKVDECFFDRKVPADVVLDMVYNPEETVLVRRARKQKKEVITGMEMFIEQAVHQFELWTATEAPRSAMESAAREALAERATPIIGR